MLGSPGQANYCGSECVSRRPCPPSWRQRLPALSINWGPWAEVGLAARTDGGERLALRGVGSIPPSEALKLLEQLLQDDRPQIAVIPLQLRTWQQFHPTARLAPFFDSIPQRAAQETDEPAGTTGLAYDPTAWQQADSSERLDMLESYVTGQAARVLGLSPARLSVHQSLVRFGLDSLMAVELKTRIQADLGVVLPVVNVLKSPSISGDRLGRDDPAASGRLERPAGNPRAWRRRCVPGQPRTAPQIDRLSDDEVDALLSEIADDATVGMTDISSDRVASLSPQGKRALLAQLLCGGRRTARVRADNRGPLPYPRAAGAVVPSPAGAAQRGVSHMLAWRIRSPPDVAALHRAFQMLTDRHASLRTTYGVHESQPVQQIHHGSTVDFEVIDTSSPQSLADRVAHEAHRSFNLERELPLRVRLFNPAAGDGVLLLAAHHIALDLWSLALLLDELSVLYRAATSGRNAVLPAADTDYVDYVRDQARMLAGPEGQRLWSYWERQVYEETSAQRANGRCSACPAIVLGPPCRRITVPRSASNSRQRSPDGSKSWPEPRRPRCIRRSSPRSSC